MNRLLFECRAVENWAKVPQMTVESGGTRIPIHNIVAKATLKYQQKHEISVGKSLETKDLFVHFLYIEDYEETVRRVLLTEGAVEYMTELLESIYTYFEEPDPIIVKLVRTVLYMCPPELYSILQHTQIEYINRVVGEHLKRAEVRDLILSACLGEKGLDEAPPRLHNQGDWTILSRNGGSFEIAVKDRDPILVFCKGKRFALTSANILGESEEKLLTFEELLGTLKLSFEKE